MKPVNRLGFVLMFAVFAVMLLMLAGAAHAADLPAMWPAHAPLRAGLDDSQQSALLGLILTIAAVLVCW